MQDLSKLLANYGATGATWSQGDFSADHVVDIANLSVMLANYNQAVFASAGIRAVPEPSVLVLLGMGAIGLLAYARPRSNRT
jgi:hypothetical protein